MIVPISINIHVHILYISSRKLFVILGVLLVLYLTRAVISALLFKGLQLHLLNQCLVKVILCKPFDIYTYTRN